MDPHSAQLRFNHHKQLLSLLKERIKDHPDVDQVTQNLILSSNNKQDYLDIVNRISISKNNTSNLIMQLISQSRETGRYGVSVANLEDLNKTWEERMRIYLVDLNKSLKEVSEHCVSIWKCFKKIKQRLSSFGPKKEEESTNIIELIKKIRSFKEELEGEVYTISKKGLNHSKMESEPSSQKKFQSIQVSQTIKDLQELRSKVAVLHDSFFKITVPRGSNIDRQQTQKMINDLQGKILIREVSPLKQAVSAGQHSQVKDKVLSLVAKFFSTRSLAEMKLIEKEFEAQVGKINDFLQLKQALKFYILDKQAEEEVPSPSLQKMTSTQQAQRVVALEKENKELKSKNLHLQQEANRLKFQPSHSKQRSEKQAQIAAFKFELQNKVESEIKLERQVKRLQIQVEELKKQLDDNRLKFSYLDNSRASTLSQQAELIHYQETRNFSSPEKYDSGSRIIQQNASPSIQQKAEGVIMEVVEKYNLLEQKLRQEIEQLSKEKAALTLQNSQLQNRRITNSFNENQKRQEDLSEYKTYIQQFWIERKLYEDKIYQQAAKIHELQQNISNFFIQQNIYKSQIEKCNRELQTLSQNEKTLKVKIKDLQQQISLLNARNTNEGESGMLQAFFIEQRLYQGQIQKLKMEREEYKSMIGHFFVEISLYKNQIQKYRIQLNEVHAQFSKIKEEAQKIYEQKIQILLANEDVLKKDIRSLKQSLQQKNGSDLSSDVRRMAEEFWMEQKKYQHMISQLTQKNYQLQQTVSSFFIEQSIYQTQLQKSKTTVKDLQKEIKLSKESLHQEEKSKKQKLMAQLQRLNEVVRQKEDIISKLQISLAQQIGSPTMAKQIIQKAKLLKKQNTILQKIQKSKGSMIEQLETQIQNLKLSVAYYRQSSLFQADIFDDNQSQKSILINLVTTQIGRNIVKTKLIYKYDPLNKVNFHNYIDNHESILLIVKTANTIIGGYYSGTLCEQLKKDNYAFLFSLDENECYPCAIREKAVTYDRYFLIMGNSELRLNVSKQEVFSNFAVNNAYYEIKGKRVKDFLREGEKRETNFLNFEVYQVQFQEALPVPQTNAQEQEEAEILE